MAYSSTPAHTSNQLGHESHPWRNSDILTSDHRLRDYWFISGTFSGYAYKLREDFRCPLVTLFVALPGPVSTKPLSDNFDVCLTRNDQVGSIRTDPTAALRRPDEPPFDAADGAKPAVTAAGEATTYRPGGLASWHELDVLR